MREWTIAGTYGVVCIAILAFIFYKYCKKWNKKDD